MLEIQDARAEATRITAWMMQLVKASRFAPLASIDAYCMIEQHLPSGLARGDCLTELVVHNVDWPLSRREVVRLRLHKLQLLQSARAQTWHEDSSLNPGLSAEFMWARNDAEESLKFIVHNVRTSSQADLQQAVVHLYATNCLGRWLIGVRLLQPRVDLHSAMEVHGWPAGDSCSK